MSWEDAGRGSARVPVHPYLTEVQNDLVASPNPPAEFPTQGNRDPLRHVYHLAG